MLTAKEKDIVDISKIEAFAMSDLGKRIAGSDHVCKEKRFNFFNCLCISMCDFFCCF